MNEQLKLLVELQRLDTKIIAHQSVITEIPGKISAMDAPLRRAREDLEAQRSKADAAEKNKRDAERDVEALAEKINKLKARTNDIKTNKEYQALLSEIETAETEKFSTEDGILEGMEAQEAEQAALKEAAGSLSVQEAEAEKMRTALEAEVGEAETELKGLKASRAAYTSGLDEDTYDDYMNILKTSRGVAVSEAANEICTGCNMNIMPQLFLHIKKNSELIACPQCKRFLYYSDESPGVPAV